MSEPAPGWDAPGCAETTQIIRSLAEGTVADTSRLMELVYDQLRKLAQGYLGKERAEHTLQPTALVHEAWIRLADLDPSAWDGRAHFLAASAQAMRRVLVDHARGRGSKKRGGDWLKVTFDGDLFGGAAGLAAGQDQALDVLELDRVLTNLQQQAPRQAKVVELRFFAGMTGEEVAEVLGVTRRTVATDWRFARAWLSKELRENPDA